MFRFVTVFALLFGVLGVGAAQLASQQFALSTQTQASACFINCHTEFTATHALPDGRFNFPSAITLNCGYDTWRTVMGKCLAVTCASAPDLAYALEYGAHYCRRAGVHGVAFPLPRRFLLSRGGQYYNETLESAAAAHKAAWPALAAAALAALLA